MRPKNRVTGPCEKCGEEVTRVRRDDRPFVCYACAAIAAVDAALQMANKSGPLYDAWLATRGPSGRPRTRKD